MMNVLKPLSLLLVPLAFSAHLAATVFMQLPGNGFGRVRDVDLFGVVPSWRFFAPRPASTDYHLFCRGVDDDGETTTWFDIHPPVERQWKHILWFPDHRTQKAVFDVMSDLLGVFRAVDGLTVNDQPPYLMLEAYVVKTALGHGVLKDHNGIQFCIATSAGFDETVQPIVLFISRRIAQVGGRLSKPSNVASRSKNEREATHV